MPPPAAGSQMRAPSPASAWRWCIRAVFLPRQPSRESASLTGRWTVGYRLPVMAQAPRVFNPDKQIDCTGLFCPMPIVKTREAIKQLAPGQLLEMLSDDPASAADMKSCVHVTGHALVAVE